MNDDSVSSSSSARKKRMSIHDDSAAAAEGGAATAAITTVDNHELVVVQKQQGDVDDVEFHAKHVKRRRTQTRKLIVGIITAVIVMLTLYIVVPEKKESKIKKLLQQRRQQQQQQQRQRQQQQQRQNSQVDTDPQVVVRHSRQEEEQQEEDDGNVNNSEDEEAEDEEAESEDGDDDDDDDEEGDDDDEEEQEGETKSLEELIADVHKYDHEVRVIKGKVKIFETDKTALAAAKRLQDSTRHLLKVRYGTQGIEPYRIRVSLEFQKTILDYAEKGPWGSFVIELAPSELVPHSIYTFLEIARHWNGGGFHRTAGHVLQVMVKNRNIKHLAFQEYSPQFPHKKRTTGYAGRPSGPGWYVSIQDNSANHGPGSQQHANPYEADSCFGHVVEGYEESVLRVRKIPGSGFVEPSKHVLITSMIIMVKDPDTGHYKDWIDYEKLQEHQKELEVQ